MNVVTSRIFDYVITRMDVRNWVIYKPPLVSHARLEKKTFRVSFLKQESSYLLPVHQVCCVVITTLEELLLRV
jgi:hypothetical protein